MQHHNWLDEESEDDQYDINNNLIQESAYKIESFPSKDVGSKHKINIINILLYSLLLMLTTLIFTCHFKKNCTSKLQNHIAIDSSYYYDYIANVPLLWERLFKTKKILVDKIQRDTIIIDAKCNKIESKFDSLLLSQENQIRKIIDDQNDFKKGSNMKHSFAIQSLAEQNFLIRNFIKSTGELFESQRFNFERFVENSIIESEKKCILSSKIPLSNHQIMADYVSEANGGRFLFSRWTLSADLNPQWYSLLGYKTPFQPLQLGPRILIQVNFVFKIFVKEDLQFLCKILILKRDRLSREIALPLKEIKQICFLNLLKKFIQRHSQLSI